MSNPINCTNGINHRPTTMASPFILSGQAHLYNWSNTAQNAHGVTDAEVDPRNRNAMCVTSRPGALLREKCMLAMTSQDNPTNSCGWKQSYMTSIDDERLPLGGVPQTCTPGSKNVCVPQGAMALLCKGESLDNGTGNINMAPVYIAVPTSEAMHDVIGEPGTHGCAIPTYDPNPKMDSADRFGYLQTRSHPNIHSVMYSGH